MREGASAERGSSAGGGWGIDCDVIRTTFSTGAETFGDSCEVVAVVAHADITSEAASTVSTLNGANSLMTQVSKGRSRHVPTQSRKRPDIASGDRVRGVTSVVDMRALRIVLCTGVTLALSHAMAVPAQAGSETAQRGQLSVNVSPIRGLDPSNAEIRVRGRGFDPRVGIYVGLCALPEQGRKPSPCGGGVNMSGADRSSAWIASNPPPYGSALAIPFTRGGRFAVTLRVSSRIGDLDCRVTRCAIVTRADHTRAGDRRFDVIVPVTFS